MTRKFQEIHAVVDRLLQEQGEYSPIELLLAEGRLSYCDYESWRCGQIAALEDVLAGNPQRIGILLNHACQYAVLLGLKADHRAFYSWGDQTGKLLRLSGDPVFEALCCVYYRRDGNEVQLDLFMDNTANLLVNGIVEALTSRRVDEAARLLERLLEIDPSHARLGVLETLCTSMQGLSEPIGDYIAESTFLEGCLVSLATEALGAKARDFLAPFWRRLADALGGQSFDAEMPNLHASYPLGCASDWSGVKASILEDPSWQDYPLLRCRLAEAEFYLGERKSALALWCRLCWDFPVEAEQLLPSVPNRELRSALIRYRELDVEPELEIAFFPVWLLLERTDTRDALLPTTVDQDQVAARAYCVLFDLLASGTVLSERTLELRRKLNQAHPGLFAIYMRRMVGAGG